VTPQVAGVHSRETWEWELTDAALVPKEYWSIDPGKLSVAVKAGARDIPGVRVFKRTNIVAR
jgi:hypothetical protein